MQIGCGFRGLALCFCSRLRREVGVGGWGVKQSLSSPVQSPEILAEAGMDSPAKEVYA